MRSLGSIYNDVRLEALQIELADVETKYKYHKDMAETFAKKSEEILSKIKKLREGQCKSG